MDFSKNFFKKNGPGETRWAHSGQAKPRAGSFCHGRAAAFHALKLGYAAKLRSNF
jgi:hypothetical protein